MRSIPLPDIDDANTYDAIVRAKRRPRQQILRDIRDEVVWSYSRYEARAPDLAKLPPIRVSPDQAEALKHGYDVRTTPMDDLRETLTLSLDSALCPLCSLTETSTLDHYLPKSLYPEFSTLSLNLVPACSKCNLSKRDQVESGKAAVRLFLHPYYDRIPDSEFLLLDIKVHGQGLGLTYRLQQPHGMHRNVFSQITSHFERLDLNDRYRTMSLVHLRGRYRALASFYGTDKNVLRVRRELSRESDSLRQQYGRNHWAAVLYERLAASEDFCGGGFEIIGRSARPWAA